MLIATATLANRRGAASNADHMQITKMTRNNAARCCINRNNGFAASRRYNLVNSDGITNANAGITCTAANTNQAMSSIMQLI